MSIYSHVTWYRYRAANDRYQAALVALWKDPALVAQARDRECARFQAGTPIGRAYYAMKAAQDDWHAFLAIRRAGLARNAELDVMEV